MKKILISIRPQWCEKIASGKKTIEVRKSAPKEVPFKAYIYCSYGNDKENYMLGRRGKVIGEFVCDKIDEIVPDYNPAAEKFFYGYIVDTTPTCLSEEEMQNYGKNKPLWFWHISDLKIYDKPKELSDFTSPRVCINYIDLPAYGHIGCNMCKYSYTINCMIKCRINGREPLTRPPQSYMLVEELKEV